HVCTRERADSVIQSFNQAFICQERYTTSCGTLDWRRCTRYRIQTCYTPQQKYTTRYHQVEQCCPGWREDGAGSCSIPVCPHLCLNGGTCTNEGGVPVCSCKEGYTGDMCQSGRNQWQAWYTVMICGFAVIVIIFVALLIYCSKRNGYIMRPNSSPQRAGYRRLIQTTRLDPGSHDNSTIPSSWTPLETLPSRMNPSAPPETSC
ncbi:multiple epidermal growth factor-like domains protein 11, partial [Mizuhopecten yessoensis]|uniref:multiple epidermal growth factor-like domains protein 11 n=1 Tax=Mizuhopecten yessoensis TaxID=6573 RepID=UPI000B45C23E